MRPERPLHVDVVVVVVEEEVLVTVEVVVDELDVVEDVMVVVVVVVEDRAFTVTWTEAVPVKRPVWSAAVYWKVSLP